MYFAESSQGLTRNYPFRSYANFNNKVQITKLQDYSDPIFAKEVDRAVSSLYATEPLFENLPCISFDNPEPCNWETFCRKTVLGPFAPKYGWILKTEDNGHKIEIRPENRRISLLRGNANWNILDKAISNSHIGRVIKNAEMTQLQQIMENGRASPVANKNRSKKEIDKEKLRKGVLWNIMFLHRKTPVRRFSEPKSKLPQILDPDADFSPNPRCRSQLRGIEYIFKLPKPCEIAKARALKECALQRPNRTKPPPIFTRLSRLSTLKFEMPPQQPDMKKLATESEEPGNSPLQNRSPVDLLKKTTVARRATLKMAIADAAKIQQQLSDFYAAQKEKKEGSDYSSSSGTRRSKEDTKSPKPVKAEAETIKAKNDYSKLSPLSSVVHKNSTVISEQKVPEKSLKTGSFIRTVQKQKTVLCAPDTTFKYVLKTKKNHALAQYISDKLASTANKTTLVKPTNSAAKPLFLPQLRPKYSNALPKKRSSAKLPSMSTPSLKHFANVYLKAKKK